MTKKQQKQFSRRFSYEDWMELCSNLEFCELLDKGTPEDVELAAVIVLTNKNKI
jgi:hypothetical protein